MLDFPNQNIPENSKNEKWKKDCVDSIISMSKFNRWKKDRDILCYQIVEGVFPQSKYDYITKELNGEQYPARMKNYPLIKPVLNTATGIEIEMPYPYHVRAIDTDSLDTKNAEIVSNIYKTILEDIYKLYENENQQEKPPLDIISQKRLKELEEKIGSTTVTEKEIIAEHLLKYFDNLLLLKEKKNDLFLDTLITGKCFWKVEIPRPGSDPKLRIIKPYDIDFSDDEDIEDISKCTWIVEKRRLTKEECLDLYGDKLKDEDIKKLDSYSSGAYNDYRSLIASSDGTLDIARIELYGENYDIDYQTSYNLEYSNKIDVYIGQWKSIRKLTMVELENAKDPNSPFYKLFTEEEIIKNERRIKNKQNKYIQELYEFVRIGEDIYVEIKKSDYQIRSIDEPYYVRSNYFGFLFKPNMNNTPFSLVWYLKDLQELYNILHYHRERIIALSGVKGNIYDLAQLPDGMELADVIYYKKLGLILIDSSKNENGFNQFSAYNDSLDASIGIITQMLEDIRVEVDRISGFNRQIQGQLYQKDLIGQIDKAIRQGSYATAVLYHHQDKVYKTLLESLINFSKFAYRDQYKFKTLSYVIGDGRQKIFTLSDDFILSDYGIFFSSSSKEQARMEELKQFVTTLAGQNQIKILDAIKILKADNLSEIESKVIKKLEEQEKMMEELQRQQAEQGMSGQDPKMQLEIEKLNAKRELELMKLKTMKEIKELEAKMKEQEINKKADIQEKKLDIDKQYKENLVNLKRELTNLEREELRGNVTNRKEIKNIL